VGATVPCWVLSSQHLKAALNSEWRARASICHEPRKCVRSAGLRFESYCAHQFSQGVCGLDGHRGGHGAVDKRGSCP
jgi:hypothetical protein